MFFVIGFPNTPAQSSKEDPWPKGVRQIFFLFIIFYLFLGISFLFFFILKKQSRVQKTHKEVETKLLYLELSKSTQSSQGWGFSHSSSVTKGSWYTSAFGGTGARIPLRWLLAAFCEPEPAREEVDFCELALAEESRRASRFGGNWEFFGWERREEAESVRAEESSADWRATICSRADILARSSFLDIRETKYSLKKSTIDPTDLMNWAGHINRRI